MQTATGLAYDYANPSPEQISLEDIAHHLAQTNRWSGACNRPYSVAEHSVRVSRILEEWGHGELWCGAGLMHDAHEAYIWDCVRPLKPLIGEVYEQFTRKADAAIAWKFWKNPGFALIFHDESVKAADDVALVAEGWELMVRPPTEWTNWKKRYQFVEPPPGNTMRWLGWDWENAKAEFLARAEELNIG